MGRPPGLQLLLLTACIAATAGCYVETARHSTWDDFAERMADAGHRVQLGGEATQRRGPQAPAERAVLIRRFTGNTAEVDAQVLVTELRTTHRLPAVWIRRTPGPGGGVAVYAGRFTEAGDTRDQRALLKRIRRLEVDGERPYRDAELVAVARGTGSSLGSDLGPDSELAPHDFRNHPGRYALQVGHYTADAEGGRHAAAEARVRELIDAGHRAFYYHGPRMSIVVVGLFDESDFVQVAARGGGAFTEQAYGPEMLALQERFPHNLRNGRPHKVTPLTGGDPTPQPSRIVRGRR